MASRIKELKDTLISQNEMIVTLRREKTEARDVMTKFYSSLVQYKNEYTTSSTGVETSNYPEVRNEDAARAGLAELIRNTGKVFQVVVTSLTETRGEIVMMYKELDQEVDDAMSQWNQIKLQEANDKKAELFRDNIASKASSKRAETPDPMVGPGTSAGGGRALPPSPPDSTGKARPEQTLKTDIPKAGTTTLEKLLSPTTSNDKPGKTIPVKTPGRK